eukprot:m.921021 g.921021  ORF g.921021 m.921021 type:complete len:1182 (-) comp23755_c0_seq4:329-3874(-)
MVMASAPSPPSAQMQNIASQSLNAAQGLVGQGSSSPTTVEVEHLDYGYVEKCTDGRHLEKILLVLKSGKEGVYPDLEEFTKRRLREIKPTSSILKETKRVQSVRELDKDERAKITREIASWTSVMSEQERTRQQNATAAGSGVSMDDSPVSLPPIRGQAATITVHPTSKVETTSHKTSSNKKSGKAIPGGDFRAWDKYDVDKALEEIELDENKITVKPNGSSESVPICGTDRTVINKDPSTMPNSIISRVPQDPAARHTLANLEKTKGNECFRAGDFDEATVYYSRSLSVDDSIVATYNNRALAYIKLSKWTRAIADLDVVLTKEPHNVKALVRKATAFKGAKKLGDALAVARRVLELAPTNKDAKKIAKECQAHADSRPSSSVDAATAAPPAPQEGKKRRMIIEEDSESEDEASSSTEPLAPAPQEGKIIKSHEGDFIASTTFAGARPGFVFQRGAQGVGYYKDRTTATGKTADTNQENADATCGGPSAGLGSGGGDVTKAHGGALTSPLRRRIAIEEDSDDESDSDDGDGADSAIVAAEATTSNGSAGNKGGVSVEIPVAAGGDEKAPITTAHAHVVTEDTVPADVQALKTNGNQLFSAGQYSAAVDTYTTAITALLKKGCHAPTVHASLLSNRAACHLKNGNCTASVDDCDAAVALSTTVTPKAVLRRASANEAQEKYRFAHNDYAALLQHFPANKAAQEGLNRCASALRSSDGREWRKRAGKPQPHNAKHALAQMPQTQGAQHGERDAPGNNNKAIAGATATAATATTSAANVKDNYEQEKARGNALVQAKEFRAAIACYTRALELLPNEAPARNNRALCHLRVGQFAEALQDTATVLATDPGNTKALFRKGQALDGLQRHVEALTAYENVLLLDANNIAARRAIDTLLKSGKLPPKVQEKAASPPSKTPSELKQVEAEMQAMESARARLEEQRAAATDQLAALSEHVASASAEVRDIKSDLETKDKELEAAKDKITSSIAIVTKDVEEQAALEQEHLQQQAQRDNTSPPPPPACAKPPSDQSVAATTTSAATTTPPRETGSTPLPASMKNKWAPADFMRRFDRERRRGAAGLRELAALLQTVAKGQLARLLSNRLEAEHVLAIVAALPLLTPADALATAHGVTASKRFDMVRMFLSDTDRAGVQESFGKVRRNIESDTDADTLREQLEHIQNLFLE